MSTEAEPVEVVAEIPAELATVVQSSGLAAESAHTLESKFAPLFAEAKSLVVQSQGITVTDASQLTQMKLARTVRLALRDVRVRADKERKAMKEDSLRRGKAIDGVYNVLAYLVDPVEEKLEAAEKFAERIEAERKAKLKADREEALRPFGVNTAFYDLANMPADAWNGLFAGAVAADKAKKEAAAKADAERIAREKVEAEERERVRLENERLKREAFEREKLAQAEREQAAAEKRAAEEKARIEREALEAAMAKQRAEAKAAADAAAEEARKIKAEADRLAKIAADKAMAEREAAEAKARAEQEAIRKQAQYEREAREKAEAEAKRLRDAEDARIAAEEAARKKAARAPDREKVRAFAASVRSLPIPQASTTEGAAVVAEIAAQVEKFAAWLEKKGAEL